MHKQIILVHVFLNNGFILLCISTSDNEIIFTGDKPDELFEPKDLALDGANLCLLQLLIIASSCLFGLLDGRLSCILSFTFFRIGFLTDLEVLLDIQLG